jgi:hypothetical protein
MKLAPHATWPAERLSNTSKNMAADPKGESQ